MEDSPADACLAKEALKEIKARSNLHVVGDGVEALAFLRRKGKYCDAVRPDLILLDLNLPKKGGLEVLAEIKADAFFKRIPVIIFSVSKAAEDIRQAYDMQVNFYIAKPTDLDQLISIMRSLEDFWLALVKLPLDDMR